MTLPGGWATDLPLTRPWTLCYPRGPRWAALRARPVSSFRERCVSSFSRLFRSSSRQKAIRELVGSGYRPIGQCEPEDVFIAGYPKSGNTWVQLLVAAMQFELNPAAVPDSLVQELVPDVHYKRYYKRFLPRVAFKTHHLPQPQYRRVIHLVRDGRDVLCSYKHYNDALGITHSFAEMIRTGAGLYPCRWHEYVEAWESNPYQAERIVVRYEDLKQNCTTELSRIAEFLSIDVSADRLAELAAGTEVAKMQQRETRFGWNHPDWPKDKKFVRKGTTGNFRCEMSPAQIQRFEDQSASALIKFGYLAARSHVA